MYSTSLDHYSPHVVHHIPLLFPFGFCSLDHLQCPLYPCSRPVQAPEQANRCRDLKDTIRLLAGRSKPLLNDLREQHIKLRKIPVPLSSGFDFTTMIQAILIALLICFVSDHMIMAEIGKSTIKTLGGISDEKSGLQRVSI